MTIMARGTPEESRVWGVSLERGSVRIIGTKISACEDEGGEVIEGHLVKAVEEGHGAEAPVDTGKAEVGRHEGFVRVLVGRHV